jgi:hypothetical protein
LFFTGEYRGYILTVPSGTAALTVWGFTDGRPYVRVQTGATTFSMVLPSKQGYIIEVVPQDGQVVNYSMQVKVN